MTPLVTPDEFKGLSHSQKIAWLLFKMGCIPSPALIRVTENLSGGKYWPPGTWQILVQRDGIRYLFSVEAENRDRLFRFWKKAYPYRSIMSWTITADRDTPAAVEGRLLNVPEVRIREWKGLD